VKKYVHITLERRIHTSQCIGLVVTLNYR